MNFLNKMKFLFHSLMWGLKGADSKIDTQVDNGSGVESPAEANGGVLDDLLKREETQALKEMRDETYRVYRKADHFQVYGEGEIRDEKGNLIGYQDVKLRELSKNKEISKENAPKDIYMEDNEKLILIQQCKEVGQYEQTGVPDYTVKIERDFFPRFRTERYIKQIVLKKEIGSKKNDFNIDLYCSVFPREFQTMRGYDEKYAIDKSDIFFIEEMNNLANGKITKSDAVDFSTLEFTTDKAFNAETLLLYKFDNIKFIKCQKDKYYFIISFKANAICNAFDLIAKYKTEELDKKIADNEQRSDTFHLNELTTNMVYDPGDIKQ